MDSAAEARIRDLVEGCQSRDIVVPLMAAMERRLVAMINRINRETPLADRFNPNDLDDLATTLIACADRGLDDSERDAGCWSDLAGRQHPLPRTNRASWQHRLRFAVRAAVTTWRAT